MHRTLSSTTVSSAQNIRDLRDALAFLSTLPGHLSTTSKAVDAHAELAGIYKRIGAGTPVAPPTRIGPAMLFENVKGYPDVRVLVGMLASRERTALLLGSTVEQLPFTLLRALDRRIAPMTVSFPEGAPCQEVVHRAPLDIRSLLPAPTNTLFDAGPYFNLGLLRAEDPETGEADVTIHRLCVQGSDRLTVYFVPGRHIDQFRIKAERQGKPLPVSISMGLDPAIYLAACFEPPTTPLGFDELTIAGGLRQRPVELVDCVSVPAKAIARAEIVIEGEILPGERMREDINTGTGFAMPEFPGYLGQAQSCPVIRVTAVTHRFNPILQTIVGPGEEHVNLAGIPTEASILRLVENSMPGRLLNVYAHSAGGGKYLAILQFKKGSIRDEGRQRQAALTAFAAFSELKHVILVDEDVDIFNSNDVLWAMTTRYQGDVSTVFIQGVRCHPLDPSQSPDFSPSILEDGISCKTIFDCTVPFALRERFRRAPFMEVDMDTES
ncbi:UbiD family decarboxylase [Acidithiobacillus sp. 'AMD consortium']|uniref:Phenolic acid decarboxylase subunit C n=3 Tax=Acidithiobacillus ferridurans TaxID=1232575 RepID=A0A2Z6IJU2_ACIFI|nr:MULTISPECIES: UbiD family decarboxylase [Acidithiobacillus]QFG78185.1 UbiD family decarboxylase [Acidithiobacillus sp. 'AMD consortium']BBF65990.1 Phenolic acid decarboxylase subunit C [Acidithiobacillus ferridurans]